MKPGLEWKFTNMVHMPLSFSDSELPDLCVYVKLLSQQSFRVSIDYTECVFFPYLCKNYFKLGNHSKKDKKIQQRYMIVEK